jgi:hypothetical protein
MVQSTALAPLDGFVGTWRVTGRNLDGAPSAAGSAVSGIESYEWLPGGFFLSYRWHRCFSGGEHQGLGVLAGEAPEGRCSARFYDSLGFARRYDGTVGDGRLVLAGAWERATIALSDDGATLHIHWDRSSDGTTWLPLCELTGTRLSRPAA